MGNYKVYAILCQIDQKVWIGLTQQPVASAFMDHKRAYKAVELTFYNLYRHFEEYGIKNFKAYALQELPEGTTLKDAIKKRDEYIDILFESETLGLNRKQDRKYPALVRYYKITNDLDASWYIGSTVRTIEERFKNHKTLARLKFVQGSCPKKIKELGEAHFKTELIDEFEVDFSAERFAVEEIFITIETLKNPSGRINQATAKAVSEIRQIPNVDIKECASKAKRKYDKHLKEWASLFDGSAIERTRMWNLIAKI